MGKKKIVITQRVESLRSYVDALKVGDSLQVELQAYSIGYIRGLCSDGLYEKRFRVSCKKRVLNERIATITRIE